MPFGTAALLGLGAITGLANTATSIWSQKDQQNFNSQEAANARAFSSQEASTARAFSAEEAQKQRDWEKMMSDTAYQRQIEDMKAAGINPASIGAAGGASTPVGSTAQTSAAQTSAASSSAHAHGSFDSLFSNAVALAMSKDRNFAREVVAEMYTSNAKQMNNVSNQLKRDLAELRDKTRRDLAETHTRTRSFRSSNGMYNIFTDKVLKDYSR